MLGPLRHVFFFLHAAVFADVPTLASSSVAYRAPRRVLK